MKKTDGFTEIQHIRAKLFKALAHPARLAILEHLAEIRTCITGDITGEIPLSRTTVNQHLKVLKNAGLIKGTVAGVKTNYCLNPAAIRLLQKDAQEFLKRLGALPPAC